jgi:hypothetical protein
VTGTTTTHQTTTKSALKKAATAGLQPNGHIPEGNGDIGHYALTMMADCLKDPALNVTERKEALWMFFDLLLTSLG